MAYCVYFNGCHSPGSIFFKGRMFCLQHAREIRKKIEDIISNKERRENRTISEHEEVAINYQRFVQTNRGLVSIRGTRLLISKSELKLMVN